MGKIKDLRGQRFGRLTVPKGAKPVMRHGHAYWPVICDCSLQLCPSPVRGTRLQNGNTVSCGCQRADPEVRSEARRRPLEDDHYDDGLQQLRDHAEACREAAMEAGDPVPASVESIRPNARPAAVPLDGLDRAIYGDDAASEVPPDTSTEAQRRPR